MSDRHLDLSLYGLLALFVLLAAPAAPADRDAGVAGAAPELRDPLKPAGHRTPAAAALDTSRWVLSSTLVADGRRVAIINGRVAAPGDTVDGALVQVVERRHAILLVGANRFTIRSNTPRVQKRTPGEQ